MISSLSIKINTNEIDEPSYTLEILEYPIYINKPLFANFYKMAMQFANNVYATVQNIINDNNKSIKIIPPKDSNTGIEQLEKMAELKEKGIITEEEFEESKNKILSKL